MVIDISGIIKNDGAILSIEFNEVIPSLEAVIKGIEFNKPVEFKGRLANGQGMLYLSGTMGTCYEIDCYRCSKHLERCIEIKVKEGIVSVEKNGDEDVYTYEGNFLDLSAIIKDNIVLSVPMRVLCSNDCKGLCHICGTDLNEGSCSCIKESGDPRFEVLKDFFKE